MRITNIQKFLSLYIYTIIRTDVIYLGKRIPFARNEVAQFVIKKKRVCGFIHKEWIILHCFIYFYLIKSF